MKENLLAYHFDHSDEHFAIPHDATNKGGNAEQTTTGTRNKQPFAQMSLFGEALREFSGY